jgi:GNAT superfamily N-acetyltransferase
MEEPHAAQGIRIEPIGAERVDELEPLARSMHAHHGTVDPAIPGIPPRDADGWWSIRRERYVAWLGRPDAFALVAHRQRRQQRAPIGYAVVSIHASPDDSHVTGDRFAELQSLAVVDGERGAGVGSAILHAVYGRLRTLDIEELAIGVLATNDAARRLYEREGFRPWVTIMLGKVPGPRSTAD